MRIIKTLVFFILTLCLTQALPFPIQDDNSQNKEFLTQDKILRMRIISDLAELTFANQESRLIKLFCAFRVAAEIDYQYHQDHPNDPYHQYEQDNQDNEELQESNVLNIQGINLPRPFANFHPIRKASGKASTRGAQKQF